MTDYTYFTKTYTGSKSYEKDLERMSAKGWEVVNAETIPIRRGCLSTVFWVLLAIFTLGLWPLLVWAFMGRNVKIVVQYRRAKS